jgi:predicted DNA-binding transcriptional regulator AlpA
MHPRQYAELKHQHVDSLLSFEDLKAIGLVNNRMTLMRWMKFQDFPEPVRLGPNTVRWRRSRIEQWLEERERRSDKTQASA